MAKATRAKGKADASAAAVLKWFRVVWGEVGGCVIAQQARALLSAAVEKGWSCEQLWRAAPKHLRQEFLNRMLRDAGQRPGDQLTAAAGDLNYVVNEDWAALFTPAFKRVATAEVKRLQKLAKAKPKPVVLVGMRQVAGPRSAWQAVWREAKG